MDLRSNFPYWLLKQGIVRSYPSLQENIKADVAIIGGGISGALTAWYLVHSGFNTILVDRRHIGMGSTAASTSLLQYEIDVPLHELITKTGEINAVRSYLLCRDALDKIGAIAKNVRAKDCFRKKPSFQFASRKKHVKNLETEFQLRKKAGFSLQWMNENDIVHHYGFTGHGGILSKDAADADAYGLTHGILKKCIAGGLKVFDHTEVIDIRHQKRSIELMTAGNKKIKAGKLVIACGYESQRYIPKKVQELHSTYVIISEPRAEKEFWYKNSLIWETNRPYLYLRTTSDNRIIIGGKDITSSDPAKRDRLLASKAKSLEKSFHELFPSIPFRTDFKWAGSFASTKDGLPFIGSIRHHPHTYFALGFGGNGITFSLIGAEIINDILNGRKNNDAKIFSFDR